MEHPLVLDRMLELVDALLFLVPIGPQKLDDEDFGSSRHSKAMGSWGVASATLQISKRHERGEDTDSLMTDGTDDAQGCEVSRESEVDARELVVATADGKDKGGSDSRHLQRRATEATDVRNLLDGEDAADVSRFTVEEGHGQYRRSTSKGWTHSSTRMQSITKLKRSEASSSDPILIEGNLFRTADAWNQYCVGGV
jgi:hypothetical protein